MEREVTIQAIEGENLILSFNDSKEEIKWPLNKINGRLEIGDTIKIRIETISKNNTNNSITTPKEISSEEERIKLLEALIN